jgi:hypothetical protein
MFVVHLYFFINIYTYDIPCYYMYLKKLGGPQSIFTFTFMIDYPILLDVFTETWRAFNCFWALRASRHAYEEFVCIAEQNHNNAFFRASEPNNRSKRTEKTADFRTLLWENALALSQGAVASLATTLLNTS